MIPGQGSAVSGVAVTKIHFTHLMFSAVVRLPVKNSMVKRILGSIQSRTGRAGKGRRALRKRAFNEFTIFCCI